jgi:hypothetical protein
METWAVITLVLGSNAIMGVVNWLMMKRQLKHSDNQLDKRMQAQRDADKRERRWEVRNEPLKKLSNELARMASKAVEVASLATPAVYESKDRTEKFKQALDDWNTYMSSGEFQQILFRQYDISLVDEVDAIRQDYELARYRFSRGYGDTQADIDKKSKEAVETIVGCEFKIAEVQSKICALLEEL